MANLKGSTFDKQIKNAKIRLEARGQSRHNKKDEHLTHSNALALKRDSYLKCFAEYAASLNSLQNKLNQYMTNEIIANFLQEKTENMSLKSAINFTRGFSAMLTGLQNTGITVEADKELFNTVVSHLKDSKQPIQKTYNREIEKLQDVLNVVSIKSPSAGAIATIQAKIGLRVSEARELLNNSQKYLTSKNTIANLKGKGNHTYESIAISKEMYNLIKNNQAISYQEYRKILKELNIKSHDFRYTYVHTRMEELVKSMPYKEALLKVSQEINHKRAEITTYYLSQTSF